MAHLKQAQFLTPGYAPCAAKILHQTHAGQAHFANGPLGAVCGMCVHYGCWQQQKNAAGDVVNTSRVSGACAKYKELAGKIGPAVPPEAAGCRYFSRKKEGQNQNQKQT
jgi:hypothetical protein